MFEVFLRHPRAVGETYAEHFAVAFAFGAHMIAGGLACIIHAFLPAAFEKTASRTVADLHTRMTTRRSHRAKQGFELDYAI